MKEYYSIGETAKLNNISIQTLRYYDKLGIFKPDHVDLKNGYRFYHIRQFFYLDIIKSLKYIQTPLEEIKKILVDTPENMLHSLKKQEKAIQEEKARLVQAEQLLERRKLQLAEQLEICKKSDEKEIYTRYIDEQKVLKIATSNSSPNSVPYFHIRKLADTLEDKCLMIDNQCGYTYEMKDYQNTNQIEYDFFYTTIPHKNIELSSKEKQFEFGTISSGEYVCIAFNWSLQQYINHYQKLYQYINSNQIQTEGNVYEVSVPINYSALREDRFITEIRIKKSNGS